MPNFTTFDNLFSSPLPPSSPPVYSTPPSPTTFFRQNRLIIEEDGSSPSTLTGYIKKRTTLTIRKPITPPRQKAKPCHHHPGLAPTTSGYRPPLPQPSLKRKAPDHPSLLPPILFKRIKNHRDFGTFHIPNDTRPGTSPATIQGANTTTQYAGVARQAMLPRRTQRQEDLA